MQSRLKTFPELQCAEDSAIVNEADVFSRDHCQHATVHCHAENAALGNILSPYYYTRVLLTIVCSL